MLWVYTPSPFGIGCTSSNEAGVRRLPSEGNPILDCVESGRTHSSLWTICHLGCNGTIRHPVDGCDDSLYEQSIHNPRPPSTCSTSLSRAMGRGGLSPRAQIYSRVTNNKREITKDKRINGKSLEKQRQIGNPLPPHIGKSPYGNKNSFLLKSLRKNLFHYYYSSHLT